ncbi:serine/threonine-protein kinase Chk2-like isoform X1 [Lycorma delicatula]|uniref:serine/threonine-protein kinase Chk2-like isoform X1 n=1 Tax=Lycorma delicatula TaxID=130591 RepID=UPI003F50EA12
MVLHLVLNIMDLEEQCNKSQLPDTQKIDSEFGSLEVEEYLDNEEVWGKLYPLGYNLQPRDLAGKVYLVGRGPSCDIQLTSQHMEPVILSTVSKIQFKIEVEKDESGSSIFSLLDLSSNGTFVNKKKVGKNKKVYLSSNDEISLSQPQNKAYLFVDSLSCNSWLPISQRNNFSIITQLGQGAFGEVKLAIEKSTGKRYAIKRILRSVCQNDSDKNQITNEIKILRRINHQFIIKMLDVFENSEAVFIVLEYMPGGDLQQKIKRTKNFDENDVKFFFYQLLLAVDYLHKEGIIHRDLKPENVLLSSESNDALLKLSDFGLSKIMHSASTLKTFCGTLLYTAPEILLSKGCSSYTPLVDVWSLGCILYLCLSGKPTFNVKNTMPVQEQIIRGYFPRIKSTPEKHISDNAIKLVEKMLLVDPSKRITVNDTIKHPWLQDKTMEAKLKTVLSKLGKENLENVSPEYHEKKRRRTEFAVTMMS